MTESPHLAVLRDLNHNYVRSVGEADVRWFDQHLAADFYNTNPDGTVLERAAFLAQIGRGSPVSARTICSSRCSTSATGRAATIPA